MKYLPGSASGKGHEGSEILFHLQANELACYSFIDIRRRHKTPGSETKDFITHGTAKSMSFMFPSLPLASRSHVGNVLMDQGRCGTHNGFVSAEESEGQ